MYKRKAIIPYKLKKYYWIFKNNYQMKKAFAARIR